MIKFTSMSSEHTTIPKQCLDKSEHKDVYCTYTWIETDEIDTEKFPIAVMDYRPKYSKRTNFIFSEPLWRFMQDERTREQQEFIDKNFDKLNELFIDFAKTQGYLENIK
jgi:hypothetical protein